MWDCYIALMLNSCADGSGVGLLVLLLGQASNSFMKVILQDALFYYIFVIESMHIVISVIDAYLCIKYQNKSSPFLHCWRSFILSLSWRYGLTVS